MSQSAVLDNPNKAPHLLTSQAHCPSCDGTAGKPKLIFGSGRRDYCTNPFHTTKVKSTQPQFADEGSC